MASCTFQFSHVVDAVKGLFREPQGRRDALSTLEDMERCRNLHVSVAIASFCLAAGLGVLAFFLINEALLWTGMAKQAAVLLVSLSWVLIFPVWALIFLFIMALLGRLGIKDVRAIVRSDLAKLRLEWTQLDALHRTLAARRWRHGDIFKSVLADLKKDA